MAEYVEQQINESMIVEYHCQDGCQEHFQAEKQVALKSVAETDFIIVILRRVITSQDGNEIVMNKTKPTDLINLR